MKHEQVSSALSLIGSNVPVLLLAGRYVPGLRLVVNATCGLTAYPYRSFLLWSFIGGTVWAIYTCSLAYLVGTALAGFPLASAIISGTITTIAIAVIFIVLRRRRRAATETADVVPA
jgi:membrane protein DedA with SNARE-associated domain